MERRSYSGSRRGFGSRPPVNQGDVLEVTIEAVGEKGDGIARKDGFVLFIPGVKEGDRVKVKVTRVLRKVGFAEVVGEGEHLLRKLLLQKQRCLLKSLKQSQKLL